ncbi:MAG: outer membrane protein transport protein [Nitrospinae bacterium]|nr:outer membrane protein transport protein [Nitrospinota bacterium]
MRPNLPMLWLAVICWALPRTLSAQPLPFGISLPPSLNFATAPNPVGSGARAVGKGTAFIGVADDATAASHNPGGLVQLERPEVSIVGSFFVRHETQDVTRPETVVQHQTLDSLDLNYLSAAYPFQLWQRNLVVSLNVQRLFDLQGKADVASRFLTLDGIQRVRSRQDGGLFTISPAAAVQLTPALSVGAAFNIWTDAFGHQGWDQKVAVQGEGRVVSGNRIVPFVFDGRITEEFTFEGFNVTVGFLWRINETFSLGGVVRTPFTADLTHRHGSALAVTRSVPRVEGEASAPAASSLEGMIPDIVEGLKPGESFTTGLSFRETLAMDMAVAYGLGLSARLSDRLTLSGDVSRVHWSAFRLEESRQAGVLLVENGAPSGKGRAVLNGQAEDTTSLRVGAEYLWIRPNVAIPFRAGVFYDPEPGAGRLDNFFGFSLGTGLARKRVILDIAYEFRTGTVHSEATNTSVQQHKILTSVIYHF